MTAAPLGGFFKILFERSFTSMGLRSVVLYRSYLYTLFQCHQHKVIPKIRFCRHEVTFITMPSVNRLQSAVHDKIHISDGPYNDHSIDKGLLYLSLSK